MKKSEIYVVIDSEEKLKMVVSILLKARENSCVPVAYTKPSVLRFVNGRWGFYGDSFCAEPQITLDQLEQLLIPMSEIEQLKQQAEALGYELVEKKREIKVGDFGVFWDGSAKFKVFDFLTEKHEGVFIDGDDVGYENFRHLTEEEKQQIQNNW